MLQLKIVTYNVHRCFGLDRMYSPERIADVISSLRPDIVGLQEVDSSLRTSNGQDQLEYIAKTTGMNSVIGPTVTRPYGNYGNAILSRYPLERINERNLTYRSNEPRGMIDVSIMPSGVHVRIINTHLGLGRFERKFQIMKIMDAVQPLKDETLILMGDFNEWFPYSRNLKVLMDIFGPIPRIASFPASWPRLALDRIWIHPLHKMQTLRVVLNAATRVASDHLPLEMTLKV